MLFAHYRELVTAQAAAGFWAIVPVTLPGPVAKAAAAEPSLPPLPDGAGRGAG
jgi:hypothetical protein